MYLDGQAWAGEDSAQMSDQSLIRSALSLIQQFFDMST